jgi:outer membrane biosynthesis protein TonB
MAKLATPKPPTPRPAQPPKEQTQKPQRPTDWTESARSAPAPVPTPLPSNPRREIAFSELPKPDRSVPKPDAPPLVTEIPKSLVTLEPVKPVQPSQAQVRPPAPTTGPLAIESVMSRAGGVQEQKIQSQVRGGAARRGPAAFDSVGTPIGRYRKMMAQSINARWQAYVAHQMDLVTLGSVKVRFDLLPDGTVEDVTLVSNDANSTLATLSIQAIMEAKIPPIPPDLVGALKDGRLEIEYTFNVW